MEDVPQAARFCSSLPDEEAKEDSLQRNLRVNQPCNSICKSFWFITYLTNET